MKKILFPAWGLNSYPCTLQPLRSYLIARRLSATPPSWVGSAVSNSVVYLAAERIHLYIEINNMRASLVWVFSRIKKLGRTETLLVTGYTSGGYDQLETSPEAIEQELRPAVCERRQTDLRQIIV